MLHNFKIPRIIQILKKKNFLEMEGYGPPRNSRSNEMKINQVYIYFIIFPTKMIDSLVPI